MSNQVTPGGVVAEEASEEEGEEAGPKSVAELLEEIAEASGLSLDEIEELPAGRRFVSGAGHAWEVRGGAPGRANDFLVIGVFRDVDDGDARAYCLPLRDYAEADKKKEMRLMPMRFFVSKTGPAVFSEALPMYVIEEGKVVGPGTFITEMASEISDLHERTGARLRIDCANAKCNASNEAGSVWCNQCGTPMPVEAEQMECARESCGGSFDVGSRFCPECGAPAVAPPPPPPPVVGRPS